MPIEYYVLKVANAGPPVGRLGENPIAGTVVDGAGRRYHYLGVLPRSRNGGFDVSLLRPGEWIVEPGLVYGEDAAA